MTIDKSLHAACSTASDGGKLSFAFQVGQIIEHNQNVKHNHH